MKIEKDEVMQMARGRWDEVLRTLVPATDWAFLCERPNRNETTCPLHGGNSGQAFRVGRTFAENGGTMCHTCGYTGGIDLIMQVNGMTFPEALKAIWDALGGRPVHGVVQRTPVSHAKTPCPEDDARVREYIERTWSQTLALDDPAAEPARRWFANRGLPGWLPGTGAVRLHPGLPYSHDNKRIGVWPCLVSRVEDVDGRAVTIHRGWITPDGRKPEVPGATRKSAPVPSDRNLAGAATRLRAVANDVVLHVAEGLETAAAVDELTLRRNSVWSCRTAGGVAGLVLPPTVRLLCIWPDRERPSQRVDGVLTEGAGLASARTLYERALAQGKTVLVMAPPDQIPPGQKGLDWNDLVRDYGIDRLRGHERFGERLDAIIAEFRSA